MALIFPACLSARHGRRSRSNRGEGPFDPNKRLPQAPEVRAERSAAHKRWCERVRALKAGQEQWHERLRARKATQLASETPQMHRA
jgi:hypothetical protein